MTNKQRTVSEKTDFSDDMIVEKMAFFHMVSEIVRVKKHDGDMIKIKKDSEWIRVSFYVNERAAEERQTPLYYYLLSKEQYIRCVDRAIN